MPDELAMVEFTTHSLITTGDGVVRLELDIKPEDCDKAFSLFGKPKTMGVIARLNPEAEKQAKAVYGNQAKQLRLSQFFFSKRVWEAVGSDEVYQAWTRKRRCAVTGGFDWDGGKGEERCDYAHVRRSCDTGKSHKPKYMGIPLVHEVHQLQHDKGERAVLEKYPQKLKMYEQSRGWFERAAVENVSAWSWTALKERFGYDSWREVPPVALREWAIENGVDDLLPECYLGETNESES